MGCWELLKKVCCFCIHAHIYIVYIYIYSIYIYSIYIVYIYTIYIVYNIYRYVYIDYCTENVCKWNDANMIFQCYVPI